HEIDISTTTGAEVERLRIAYTYAHRCVLLKSPANFQHHVLLGVVSSEGLERISLLQLSPELAERERALFVRRDAHVSIALINATEKTSASRRHDEPHARRLENVFLHRSDDFVHHSEVCAFRTVNADFKLRLVDVRRNELLLHCAIKRNTREHNGKRHECDGKTMPHRKREHVRVSRVNITIETTPRSRTIVAALHILHAYQA